MNFLSRLFKKPAPSSALPIVDDVDTLDAIKPSEDRGEQWRKLFGRQYLDAKAFPIVPDGPLHAIGDAAVQVSDSNTLNSTYGALGSQTVPEGVYEWFASGGFPGYPTLAILAQHWLIDKACTMAPEDAARNGYDISLPTHEGDASETVEIIAKADKQFDILNQLKEAGRFANVFGVRLCLFEVDSDDPDYYSKPFNIDGVRKGSYKGISQIDAQWVMPVLSQSGATDPASRNFYEPEFWTVSGRKYHRSHLVILRGPAVPDVLKPSYIFGGLSLVQRIYEHVYDAERTAAEAPRLAMAKRTTSLKVDLPKAEAKRFDFDRRISQWVNYRDNFGIKILDKNEEINETDTSLSDFDSVIMNQYQIVAAIAKVPATKLLGTSPKGFNATGEFEMLSYHEELESIQDRWYNPILHKHYQLLTKSLFGSQIDIDVAWNPVNAMTATQLAEINKIKMETGTALINAGVISPDEERNRLRSDPKSGYVFNSDETEAGNPTIAPEAPEPPAEPVKGPERPEKSSLPRSVGDSAMQKVYNIKGYRIVIETPAGEIRSGLDMSGNPFVNAMPFDYGYIDGIMGADGDYLDCFVGPNALLDPNPKVFVITQNNPETHEFDEHKLFIGFSDARAAMDAYSEAYSDDWRGFGGLMALEDISKL